MREIGSVAGIKLGDVVVAQLDVLDFGTVWQLELGQVVVLAPDELQIGQGSDDGHDGVIRHHRPKSTSSDEVGIS
ncbi:Hypothetical protein MVR_LOCUS342 [uncultured virus]|nr:Hypothetical protein MVR_LOCUS342 [uncultured virus]